MPKLLLRYEIPEQHVETLGAMMVKAGGKKGLTRTAQLLGVHRDTLIRGLQRRVFGEQVGRKIIDAFSAIDKHLADKMVFKCK